MNFAGKTIDRIWQLATAERVTALLLLLAVAASFQAHSQVLKEFMMPTYGNTNIHVASERHLLEHGEYPLWNDYSYGGGAPNTYVPLYRFAVAQYAAATGLDLDSASRLFVLFFALLLPLGFYCWAKELFGQKAGIAAAFFASLPAELLIYTVRPLPQGFGLVLLPFLFAVIWKKNWPASLLFSFAITMVHQEAAVFFVVCLFGYAMLQIARRVLAFLLKREWRKGIAEDVGLPLACWAIGTFSYLGWQQLTFGTWNIFSLAQFKHHEGAAVTMDLFFSKTGWLVPVLAAIGLWLVAAELLQSELEKWAKESSASLYAAALFLASVFFVKNDEAGRWLKAALLWLGGVLGTALVAKDATLLTVFMDRFIVYLQVPLIALAGLGAAQLHDWLDATAS